MGAHVPHGSETWIVPTFYQKVEDLTALGVTGSREIDDYAGVSLPLLPLLTADVNDSPSGTAFSQKMLKDLVLSNPPDGMHSLDQTLGRQLDVLTDHGVDEVAFWVGGRDAAL